jgi:hypothetical protein
MRVLLRFVGSSAIEGVGAGDAQARKAGLDGEDLTGGRTACQAAGVPRVNCRGEKDQ